MFKKILIVNRGEIAVRIIRACRQLGIVSAAIYSDADKNSLHTRLADEAYNIGPAQPGESYLNIPKIIKLAERIKADAIHPGYGFLSERAEFIEAIEKTGITFIGPDSESVKMMGNKTAARTLMQKNNVPIVPGTTLAAESADEAEKAAQEIGFPVLLKAASGGGGKGMKRVDKAADFLDAFDSAQREALKAFGDESVYIEKFIDDPKHIEVQIIGDKHGNYRHLFERECSVQRRHQKIIEEAPSSFVDPETRKKITEAAINAAKACNYYNAGTVELLMDKNKNFYFLEMNTRLQVEHPVTEFISGVNLVKEQISVAAGNELSFQQDDLKIHGHSVECRVYAEDPDSNFMPVTGTIKYQRLPSGAGIRCDEGIDVGSEVTTHYDPLLTKVIVHADSRESAINKMKYALENYRIAGLKTNIQSLIWFLDHEKFRDGSYSINIVDKEFIPLLPVEWKKDTPEDLTRTAAAFGALLKHARRSGSAPGEKKKISENNLWISKQYD